MVPDPPDIARALNAGSPGKRQINPHCPICGADCEFVFVDDLGGEILGCESCIRTEDAWEHDECWEP